MGANLAATFAPARPKFSYLDRTVWVLCGLLGLLLLAIYFPTLRWTGQILLASDDMAHGLLAPFVALYVVATGRRDILQPPARPSYWGIGVLLLSGALGVIASVGASATLLRCAFFGSLTGAILVAGGVAALSRLKFPLFLLLFSVPVPQTLYAELTGPLQSLATHLSRQFLEWCGFSVVQEGNLLELPHFRLSIVEACSGIRSLITLMFFCVLYAYFWERTTVARITFVALSIPAALVLNVTRITATGVLGETHPAFAQGIYHEALGWVCLVLAFGVVLISFRAGSYGYRTLRPSS